MDKEIKDRLDKIELFVDDGVKFREEMRIMMTKMAVKIYGDDDANPPVVGMHDRIKVLEGEHKERMETKKSLLKVAVGALTMAVGAAVLWIWGVLHDAFIKH